MKKNLKSKREKEPKKLAHKTANIILTILFFTGTLLTIWEIDIYRKTLIDFNIPFSIWIITGVLCQPFTKKYYNTTQLFLQLGFNIAGIGGIVLFLFMGINKYVLLDKNEITIHTKILDMGKLGKGKNGCANPYAEVRIDDFEKQLIFPCDSDLEGYDSIELKLRKGILGFDVITFQKLVTRTISNAPSFIQNQKIKYNFALISCDTCVPISNIGWRVMVELNEKEEKIVKNLNRATWLKLLNNEETDWSANLMLYYIYNKDAILLMQNKDINVWKKYAKAEDLAHWSTILKD
jgi:hypothetical protein